ncbi:MAG: hypothetical protein ACXV7J_08795 [Methylomonas sp.]
MKRIDTPNRSTDLFGAGKDGFRDGNKAAGIAATEFNASWANSVQEEIVKVIEAAGITLNAADLTQLLAAIPKIGLGGSVQSWQEVTSSRALATTYTNTTGRPIFVVASMVITTTTPSTITATINGVGPAWGSTATAVVNAASSLGIIVPPGATYAFNVSGGPANLYHWHEMR